MPGPVVGIIANPVFRPIYGASSRTREAAITDRANIVLRILGASQQRSRRSRHDAGDGGRPQHVSRAMVRAGNAGDSRFPDSVPEMKDHWRGGRQRIRSAHDAPDGGFAIVVLGGDGTHRLSSECGNVRSRVSRPARKTPFRKTRTDDDRDGCRPRGDRCRASHRPLSLTIGKPEVTINGRTGDRPRRCQWCASVSSPNVRSGRPTGSANCSSRSASRQHRNVSISACSIRSTFVALRRRVIFEPPETALSPQARIHGSH